MNPESISPPPPPLKSSEASFPILIISIVGILATAIFLLSYYVFVIKCCLNWHRSGFISGLAPHQLHRRRSGRRRPDIFGLYSSMADSGGLHESAIQAIPTLRYRRNQLPLSIHECAVCLNEFKEEERIRLLPSCFHGFHIDCIDAWLQTQSSCPLCRSEITSSASIPTDRIMESNPIQNSSEMRDDEARRRDDGNGDGDMRIQERNGRKKLCNSSMGDECINLRGERREFSLQPMRRSFSMDSSNNRELYIAVQEIMKKKNGELQVVMSSGEGSSNGGSGRVRRPFFSFAHCRSSKNSVLPLQYEV